MYRSNSFQTVSNKVWILSHVSQSALAADITKSANEHQPKSDERKTRQIEYKQMVQWGKFADGFPNLFITDVKEIAGKDVILIASFHSVDVIFEQLSLMYALPRYLASSLTIIMPYFPTGTMERIDEEGQVATAKSLASMLSNTPMTAGGPPQIMIFDIHALQERFYFNRSVIPRLETAIPLIVSEIRRLVKGEWAEDEIAIAFPDDGAEKRFRRYFPSEWSRIVCSKQRDSDGRRIRIREGDPDGKRVVIVDDLVQTGGTLLEAGKVLIENRAKSVCAYVTHAVFPKESWRQFTDIAKTHIEQFWITDSLPHAREIATNAPFKLLPLAPVIAEILLGFDLRGGE